MKRLKLNLLQVFEASLSAAVREKEREAWVKRNQAALDAYNQYVEEHGVFSDPLRSF